MISYAFDHGPELLTRLVEHLQLTGLAMGLALILASLATLFLIYLPRLQGPSLYLLSLLYAIPSFALFALLIPLTGLGKTTAILVLVIYAQYSLVRSFVGGLDQLDPAVLEAARGMGLTRWQILTKIQLPLALPALIAGIKVTMTSVMAIATIGATINAGGLGTLLFDGLRTMSLVELAWGILLTVLLSVLLTWILDMLEEILRPKIPEGD